jgi:NADP-dependent 3-hydroxy acid dehydrogenase YdfG
MSSTTARSDTPLGARSAVITGASRGIGRECARLLSAAGATVVLLGRDMQAMTQLGHELKAKHAAFSTDLAYPDVVAKGLGKTREYLGGAPDIIVNNAAQFQLAPVDETPLEDFERTLAVNLTSHFAIVREFLGDMRARGSGDIVTIGSIADHTGLSGNAAYGASKFGLRGLHAVLREELRGSGVRATLISPGRVDTGIWDPKARMNASVPLGRAEMLAAEHVAQAVLFAVTRPRTVNVDELRISRA